MFFIEQDHEAFEKRLSHRKSDVNEANVPLRIKRVQSKRIPYVVRPPDPETTRQMAPPAPPLGGHALPDHHYIILTELVCGALFGWRNEGR